MELWLTYIQSLSWDIAARITLAAFLGGIVGLEREWNGHAAGLRTTVLVCLGACLFTVLSIYGFPLHGSAQDTGRIAAQIVSGIGFLGAGALFLRHDQIKGLTTAATIWIVAAIGMTAGTGMYFIATFTTAMTIIVLVLLKPVDQWIDRRSNRRRGSSRESAIRTAIQQPGADAANKPTMDDD